MRHNTFKVRIIGYKTIPTTISDVSALQNILKYSYENEEQQTLLQKFIEEYITVMNTHSFVPTWLRLRTASQRV